MNNSGTMVNFDDLVDEFKDGFVSPLIGIVVTVLFYACTQIFIALKAIQIPNNPFSNGLTFTPDTGLLFVGIFALVTTIIEVFTDIGQSYKHPSLGVAKVAGVLCGTLLFWGALVNITSITGGTYFDLALSVALAFGAPLFGIYLRYKFR